MLRVTAYSKRWWGPKVKEARQAYAQAKRAWQEGVLILQDLREARNHFYRTVRRAKRECWQDFLVGPGGMETKTRPSLEDSARCWAALRYTTLRANEATPVLKGPQGQIATTIEEKEVLIQEVLFPPAPEGGPDRLIQLGAMHQSVDEALVRQALFSQSIKKAPGVDKLNFRAIRLLWEWESTRIVALVRQCFRLGVHPQTWKTARGILLRKPNKTKEEYSLVKAYRVISLINCLGKVVEKLAAEAIATHCEAT
jgi:hypothetical protein